jgi:uncharacterized membrane protein YkoI
MKPLARVLLFLLLTGSVSARDLSQDEALRLREQGRIIPLEKLLALVEKHHPQASLLEVELEEDDGIYVYEVELATREGVVRELEINAATGKILKDEEDD